MTESLARLPSVDKLLAHPEAETLVASFGHALTVDALRLVLDDARASIRAGSIVPEADALRALASARFWRPDMLIVAERELDTALRLAPTFEPLLEARLRAAMFSQDDRSAADLSRRLQHVRQLYYHR